MFLLRLIWVLVRALFAKRADLVAENLAWSIPTIVRNRPSAQLRIPDEPEHRFRANVNTDSGGS